MTIESWKEEFLPGSPDSWEKMSDLEALKHAEKKWKGLSPENLEKHGLRKHTCLILGTDGVLRMDGHSCALCQKHDLECSTCPLQDCELEWGAWVYGGDAKPMQNLIRTTLEKKVND